MEADQTQQPQITAASSSAMSWQAHAPWLELPQPLSEMILERLPIEDYIKFGAVCLKWRSIQRGHRLRRGRMLQLPWICHFPCCRDKKQPDPKPFAVCYSPLKAKAKEEEEEEDKETKVKFLHLPIPESALCRQTLGSPQAVYGSSHGWLILHMKLFTSPFGTDQFSLFNPVTGQHIKLPRLVTKLFTDDGIIVAPLSAPPTADADRDCVFMMASHTCVYLCRLRDSGWSVLPRPQLSPSTNFCSYDKKDIVTAATFFKGRFYGLCLDNRFFVVNPTFPKPSIKMLTMEWSHPPFGESTSSSCSLRFENRVENNGDSYTGWTRVPFHQSSTSPFARFDHLVEHDGDLLLVLLLFSRTEVGKGGDIQDVQLFKADFERKMWVKVESLGGHALFLGTSCSYSLLASGAGCMEKNCVYFSFNDLQMKGDGRTAGSPITWTGFELGSQRVVHGPPFPDVYRHSGQDNRMRLQTNCAWVMPGLTDEVCAVEAPTDIGGSEKRIGSLREGLGNLHM